MGLTVADFVQNLAMLENSADKTTDAMGIVATSGGRTVANLVRLPSGGSCLQQKQQQGLNATHSQPSYPVLARQWPPWCA